MSLRNILSAKLGSQSLLQKRQLNVWGIRLRDTQNPSLNQLLLFSICHVARPATHPAVRGTQKASMPRLAHALRLGNAGRNT